MEQAVSAFVPVTITGGHLTDDALWRCIELDIKDHPEQYPGYHDSILYGESAAAISDDEIALAVEHLKHCPTCQQAVDMLKMCSSATS